MMVEGNIALVPDEDSLRTFMTGLPAFFLGEAIDCAAYVQGRRSKLFWD